ncbi:MAG: c-type cytochrome [Gammaproteobacteria bacterium]
MRFTLSTALLLGLIGSGSANATAIYAGKIRAEAVCSQCHGLKKISSDAPFPPLEGRDPIYLQLALRQYRDKLRPDPVMQAIAGSMTDQQIADVAGYYGSLKAE